MTRRWPRPAQHFAAAPEDRDAAERVLTTLVWTGRFDEVLALYRERWGDLAALDAYFGPTRSGPFAAIAAAQRATGDEKGLAETLALWRKRLDFRREQGYRQRRVRDDRSPLLCTGRRARCRR